MGAYLLWHPAYVVGEPLTLEAFVTMGDALLEPRAGGALDVSVRTALGLPIDGEPADLEPARSSYFTSYRDSALWEDRWASVWRWRTRVGVDESRRALPAFPDDGCVDIEAAGNLPGPPEVSPCLLVVDARTPAEARRAATVVTRVCPDARIERGRALDRFPQLRVDLGPKPVEWYEAGADEAEALLAALADLDVSLSATTLDRLTQPTG